MLIIINTYAYLSLFWLVVHNAGALRHLIPFCNGGHTEQGSISKKVCEIHVSRFLLIISHSI